MPTALFITGPGCAGDEDVESAGQCRVQELGRPGAVPRIPPSILVRYGRCPGRHRSHRGPAGAGAPGRYRVESSVGTVVSFSRMICRHGR